MGARRPPAGLRGGTDGQRTIRTIGADGYGDRALTTGPGDQHDPAWSRRNVIAFVQEEAHGQDIYTVPPGAGRRGG